MAPAEIASRSAMTRPSTPLPAPRLAAITVVGPIRSLHNRAVIAGTTGNATARIVPIAGSVVITTAATARQEHGVQPAAVALAGGMARVECTEDQLFVQRQHNGNDHDRNDHTGGDIGGGDGGQVPGQQPGEIDRRPILHALQQDPEA